MGPIQINWLDKADSTNNVLLRGLESHDNLSVVAARFQEKGRGQRGNTWLSAPGENLTFSILLKPNSLPASAFMSITHLASTAVRDWLREKGADAMIKWPNDIYVGRKKICGMLIESRLEERFISASVVGIGVNLNQTEFPGGLPNPTSLKLLTGQEYKVETALEELLEHFRFSLLESPEGREKLYSDYCSTLFQKGESRPYRNLLSGEEFQGTIASVTPSGMLLMEDGRDFDFKEIGYIL